MPVKTLCLAVVLATALANIASAGDWSHYANGRYAYSIDIPPDFSDVAESGNGDGGVSMSANGKTKLSVWGSYITGDSFASEIAWRIGEDKADGWTISYEKRMKTAASWSGSKGNRVFYERSVVGCDGAAVYFNIEYDRAELKAYDGIVKRLVKSLRGEC